MYSLPIAAHANTSPGPATMGGAGELSVWEGSSESGGVEPRREEHTASTETGADVQRDWERGILDIFAGRTHMSGLAGVEKPTEGERNGVKDKKKFWTMAPITTRTF